MEQQTGNKETSRRYYPLTLDTKTAGEVDKFAEEREWSKSKAASRLIELGLEFMVQQSKMKNRNRAAA
jgi:hypothetical protein